MKRLGAGRTLAGLLALLAAGAFSSDPVRAQHRVEMPVAAPEAVLPEGADSLRLPLRTSENHILLPVSINGSEPLPVVLDTGMPMPGLVLFDGPHVETLALAYGPAQAQVGGAGGDGARLTARIAPGARLGLGEATLEDVQVIVMPPIRHFALPHAGVIGAAVFRNFTVRVDYDAGEIVLTRPGRSGPPAGATAVPIDLQGNLPFLTAGVSRPDGREVPVRLVLDLGATHPVSLNASSHDQIDPPATTLATRIGRGVSGEVTGQVGRIPALTLGGRRLDNVVATFPDVRHEHPRGMDSRDGNLGMGVLSRFNFTLDYAASMIYVEPNRKFAEPFEWDMSGLVLDPSEDEGFLVAAIVAGSPADEAGIRVGDVILAVDGEAVARDAILRLREILRRVDTEVSLTIRRGEETESARLKLRRLI